MALQQPWQELANSLQQLIISHQTIANSAQGFQQAVAAVATVPPPDQACQQQVLQLLATIQLQVANIQANMHLLQTDIAVMKRSSANASAQVSNSRTPTNMPLQWLYNDQGLLPCAPSITWETLFDEQHVNEQQLNDLLQHYDLAQQAQAQDFNANQRRFLLLRHLGATRA